MFDDVINPQSIFEVSRKILCLNWLSFPSGTVGRQIFTNSVY